MNWEIGIDIYTLMYIYNITKKDLLYSTGNSGQYHVTSEMGKEFEKECMRKTQSLGCIPETNTILLTNCNSNIK